MPERRERRKRRKRERERRERDRFVLGDFAAFVAVVVLELKLLLFCTFLLLCFE